LAVPLLYFGPRRVRPIGAACTVAFQLIIFLTGNYTFFNVLTIALAVWLLDDAEIGRWLPESRTPRVVDRPAALWVRGPVAAVLVLILVMSTGTLLRTLGFATPVALDVLDDGLEPLHLTSGYGLFAVMTTTRPEIQFEGSDDQVTWTPYAFRYKPGDPLRPPPWIAPFHPRLDWQLWFAALSDAQSERWVVSLSHRLLDGSPSVVGLLAPGPWTPRPPRFVRATLYEYRFTTWSEAANSGAWWARQPLRPYLPVLTLENGSLKRVD
jgi:hypothetical protein